MTLVKLLRERARERPDQRAYTFLNNAGNETATLTYGELDARARSIAARLQEAVIPGERALLLYPPGLEFVAAFLGCLYGGVIAVPAYPPRSNRTLPRLLGIAQDARPAAILTTADLLPKLRTMIQDSGLEAILLLATDAVDLSLAEAWKDPRAVPGDLAFLQYTSGSTASPKGVMVSHGNLFHNEAMISAAFGLSQGSVIAGWLPLHHDMGLIGNVLQPLYLGATCVLMSPLNFLQQPALWLQAITRYRAVASGGPNFAYDLCVRKIDARQRQDLDLTSWELAYNGAEQVRSDTMDRFARAFAPCGFHRDAFFPCYGLAEATLFVTGGGRLRPRREDRDRAQTGGGPGPGGGSRGRHPAHLRAAGALVPPAAAAGERGLQHRRRGRRTVTHRLRGRAAEPGVADVAARGPALYLRGDA